MTPQLVIQKARTFLRTPWKHQARCKGVAVDCIGLLVGAFCEAGAQIDDVIDYGRNPNPRRFLGHLSEYFVRVSDPEFPDKLEHDVVSLSSIVPGDVLVFSFVGRDLPQHVGISTGSSFIHTYESAGCVAEHALGLEWQRHLHSVWRLKAWQRS